MDYAYRYGDARRLYLNVTNRCTNTCQFCVRYRTEGLGGALLWGGEEPDLKALQKAVEACGPLESFREFIWCGYGEPTFRIDLIAQAAPWLRSRGATVRLNTNGHASLINARDVLPELSKAVDEVSISLNAPDCQRYLELCRPGSPDSGMEPRRFWDAMIDFLSRAPEYFESPQASVVGCYLGSYEIEQCRMLAGSLGIRRFRVR
jgi:TatD DNase family protein